MRGEGGRGRGGAKTERVRGEGGKDRVRGEGGEGWGGAQV